MPAKNTDKQTTPELLRENFEKFGMGEWPKGWAQEIAEKTGGKVKSIRVSRCRMAKTWKPADPPPDPAPASEPAEVSPVPQTPEVAPANAAEPAVIEPEVVQPSDEQTLRAALSKEPEEDGITAESIKAAIDKRQAERAGRVHLCRKHREILEASAITEDRQSLWETIRQAEDLPRKLSSWGNKVIPCMATYWVTVSGNRVPQIRLDDPITNKQGDKVRYLFPKDSGGIVGTDEAFRPLWNNTTIPMLLVEGTKQFQAAASTINPDHPIAVPFGIAGCWGWSKDFKPSDDLLALPAEGRDVLVAFDADITTNWMVWEAARRLERYLLQELGARSVRFLINPGTGGDKDGLDDFLGRQPTLERRINRLRHLIDTAVEHSKISPKPRKPTKGSSFFDGNNLQVASCWEYLDGEYHLAMSGDETVAVYSDGVYWNGPSLWWQRLLAEVLGQDYKPEHKAAMTQVALAYLKTEGRRIPFQQPRPVINFQNCLLDARTMERRDHTHEHLTLVQMPHEWNPKAECPVFLKWIEQVAPGQLEGLLDVCSQMLDLSAWPTKIVFLSGPTRSGKSTWIRILCALVGDHLRSNVSLHDLSKSGDDRFATSSLFGKVLNTFADLSASDLQDLSLVKVLTGGDEFEAQRKGSPRFKMRNQAMLVFSANSIPATSENSGAFLARVAPFEFPFSFAGAEDPTIEERILENELPGVQRMLVEALHARKLRGNFLPQDKGRMETFAEKTDKVRMFLRDRTIPGDRSRQCIRQSELFDLYRNWTEEENGGRKGLHLGKQNFNNRVRLAGVEEFKPKGAPRCWNLLQYDADQDDFSSNESGDQGPPKVGTGGEVPSSSKLSANKTADNKAKKAGSPVSEGATSSKVGTAETPVVEVDLAGETGGGSPKSPVCPYSPHQLKKEEREMSWRECSESGENGTLGTVNRPGQGAETLPSLPSFAAPIDDLIQPGSTDPLVVDLETHSADLLWSQSGFIRLVGTDHGNNTDPSQLLEHQGPLVAHNGFGFDFLALAHHHGLDWLELSESGRLIDTMVLETLAHPNREDLKPEQYRRELGLNVSAERRGLPGKTDDLPKLARKAAKDAGHTGTPTKLQNIGFGLIPTGDPDYNAYLRGDIQATRAIFDSQCPDGELTPYQLREMKLMGRLAYGITLVGFRIDRAEIECREAAKQAKVAAGTVALEAIGLPKREQKKDGKWTSPHSSAAGKAAIDQAFTDLGVELPRTATGLPQIKADTLKELAAANSDKPAVVDLCDTIAALVGARSTMGNLLKYADGDRVHPSVMPLQATGRCSITNPGLTVLGKRGANAAEREVFLPDNDDEVLIAIDLSKADARAVAVHSQDNAYLDIFDDPDRDINKELAAKYNIEKAMAKALGHGTRYNQQAKGMHNQTGIDLDECNRFIKAHRRDHRAVHRWIDRVVAIGESGRPLDNGFGRKLYTGRHTKGQWAGESKAFTQAPAYLGQSTTREWMAEGILNLPLEAAKRIRCFLHDEVVLSVPRAELETYKQILLGAFQFEWAPDKDSMVIPVDGEPRKVKVVAELSQPGKNWADCYRGE